MGSREGSAEPPSGDEGASPSEQQQDEDESPSPQQQQEEEEAVGLPAAGAREAFPPVGESTSPREASAHDDDNEEDRLRRTTSATAEAEGGGEERKEVEHEAQPESVSDAEPDSESTLEAETERLRQNFRASCIVQFCRMFGQSLKIKAFSGDALERALLDPRAHADFWRDLVYRLTRQDASVAPSAQESEGWEAALADKLAEQWTDYFPRNPLAARSFFDVTAVQRVRRLGGKCLGGVGAAAPGVGLARIFPPIKGQPGRVRSPSGGGWGPGDAALTRPGRLLLHAAAMHARRPRSSTRCASGGCTSAPCSRRPCAGRWVRRRGRCQWVAGAWWWPCCVPGGYRCAQLHLACRCSAVPLLPLPLFKSEDPSPGPVRPLVSWPPTQQTDSPTAISTCIVNTWRWLRT